MLDSLAPLSPQGPGLTPLAAAAGPTSRVGALLDAGGNADSAPSPSIGGVSAGTDASAPSVSAGAKDSQDVIGLNEAFNSPLGKMAGMFSKAFGPFSTAFTAIKAMNELEMMSIMDYPVTARDTLAALMGKQPSFEALSKDIGVFGGIGSPQTSGVNTGYFDPDDVSFAFDPTPFASVAAELGLFDADDVGASFGADPGPVDADDVGGLGGSGGSGGSGGAAGGAGAGSSDAGSDSDAGGAAGDGSGY